MDKLSNHTSNANKIEITDNIQKPTGAERKDFPNCDIV